MISFLLTFVNWLIESGQLLVRGYLPRWEPRLATYWRGRRCIVTGGASGIGLAVVRRLRSLGAEVLAVDLNQQALDALAQSDSAVHTLTVNLTAADAPQRVVDAALEKMGGIDFLHNNAGVFVVGRLVDHSRAQLQGLTDVNFVAPVALTQAVIPVMLDQGRPGDIAFTASMSSWSNVPSLSVYGGTKGGIKTFIRTLHREVGHRINLSGLYPCIVKTNLAPPEVFAGIPGPFVQTVDEVAHALLWGVVEKRRDIFVSTADNITAILESVFPGVGDAFFTRVPKIKDMLSGGTSGFLSRQANADMDARAAQPSRGRASAKPVKSRSRSRSRSSGRKKKA